MHHRVLIHAVFETTISQDDLAYAKSVAERLFEDEVTSKAEMFSVRVERVEAGLKDTGPEHSPLPWEAFPEKIIVADPERARVVIRAANLYRVAVEDNPERWEQALKDFEFICRAVNSIPISANPV